MIRIETIDLIIMWSPHYNNYTILAMDRGSREALNLTPSPLHEPAGASEPFALFGVLVPMILDRAAASAPR
jgi:hypothetical protein